MFEECDFESLTGIYWADRSLEWCLLVPCWTGNEGSEQALQDAALLAVILNSSKSDS